MKKRFILSPVFILLLLLAGYEIYTSFKGRELLTAAHLVEGLALAAPVKMQITEFYNMQGDFPASNAELGLPPPQSIAGRGVKSVEVSLGGKITITYNNALKKDSSIILTPSTASGYTVLGIKWTCATETIKQSYFDTISMPCFYLPPGMLSKLMKSIASSNEAEARAAILGGANVNGTLHGDSPLISVISRGHYTIAQQLIDAGADVNQKSLSSKKITPLIHAVVLGRDKLLALLLDSGADIDAIDRMGKTALIHAVEKGRESIVEALLLRGANPLLKDGRGSDAARYAKKYGRHEGIAKLIESAGSAYSAKSARPGPAGGVSDLMRAASQGEKVKVQQLIRTGAAVDEADNFNATALHYALESQHGAIANILITSGISVNSVDRDGRTPLLLAVKNGSSDVVAVLLQSGAKVNVEDRYQNTPFLMAVRYGYQRIVALLLSADVNESINKALYEVFSSPASAEDLVDVQRLILDSSLVLKRDEKDLEILLVKAVQKRHVLVVQFLLKHGVDLEVDIKGLPLLIAAQDGAYNMVKLLAEHGANINAVTEDGRTALMFSVKSGNIRMVKYLLDAGAKVDVTDVDGLSALRMAKANYAEDIVKLLRQYK
ncbi:MAG: ankyrin repeat domain-containing protein [Ectothiorhodospiraceae bacterium]|nr:ankyrin repeat domain-containing protein [Ectothiorhodospiraceae bacterium]